MANTIETEGGRLLWSRLFFRWHFLQRGRSYGASLVHSASSNIILPLFKYLHL
jgi:hypothetical protein